jgi:hypothetical protein
MAVLRAHGRRRAASRLQAAAACADRAELLAVGGARLKDPTLLRMALDELTGALSRIEPAYEPLSWTLLATLRGAARGWLAELEGDLTLAAGAVSDLVAVLETVTKDHSPLDWARAQQALAGALQIMGEAADCDQAFDQAAACHARALTVLGAQPALIEAPAALHNHVQCLVRAAELRSDLPALARAEAALRADLAASKPAKDPIGWGVRQLSFARLYEARANIAGRNPAEDAAAALALAAALDVFGEHGRRELASAAADGLERLRSRASRRPIPGA